MLNAVAAFTRPVLNDAPPEGARSPIRQTWEQDNPDPGTDGGFDNGGRVGAGVAGADNPTGSDESDAKALR